MSLIRLNTRPSTRDLRIFACLLLIFAGTGGYLAWSSGSREIAVIVWAGAGFPAGIGLPFPQAIRWVYLAAIYITFPIGFVGSFLILAGVYFLIMTPIGLAMRLFRYDPLTRRREEPGKTYWKSRTPSKPPDSYLHQH